VSVCRKESESQHVSPSSDAVCVEHILTSGNLITRIQTLCIRVLRIFQMSSFKKTLKTAIVTGACGIGLCAIARKLNLPRAVSGFAQSVEAVPFPGTRLYAFLAAKQLRPLYAAVADQMSKCDAFRRVLDLDTGPGYLAIELARRKRDLCIIGVDDEPDMIRLANANARVFRAGQNVEFKIGDPSNLPYPGRYFDVVVSANVLHHWRDPLAVFEEVYHILAPGGQFWIYDYRKDIADDMWDRLECKLSPLNRLALEFGPVAASHAAYSESELLDLAERAHFVDPSVEQETLPLFGCKVPAFMRLILHKAAHNQD
jgi:SAM-dependent methyltransferase